jgi:hypothetical protein
MKYIVGLAIALGTSNMVSAASWGDPRDPVAITTEAVAKKRQPILRVFHEEGHGGWQFYDDAEPLSRPVVMPKEELIRLDPTLDGIKNLLVGLEAMRRNRTGPWVRRKANKWGPTLKPTRSRCALGSPPSLSRGG